MVIFLLWIEIYKKMSDVNFYSDIKMGSWGFPIHIGCYNFNWNIYCDEYDYSKPTTYGCEITNDKLWLIKNETKYAIFDRQDAKYSNIKIEPNKKILYPQYGDKIKLLDIEYDNMLSTQMLSVAKNHCMELYNDVISNKQLIIGKTNDIFYNVYQEFNGKINQTMMSFAQLEVAELYKEFLIRIPYSQFHTKENMHIRKMNIND